MLALNFISVPVRLELPSLPV